jgi:hypothetical protein
VALDIDQAFFVKKEEVIEERRAQGAGALGVAGGVARAVCNGVGGV